MTHRIVLPCGGLCLPLLTPTVLPCSLLLFCSPSPVLSLISFAQYCSPPTLPLSFLHLTAFLSFQCYSLNSPLTFLPLIISSSLYFLSSQSQRLLPAPDHCRGNLRCIVNTFRVHCRESSRQSGCQCGNDYPSTRWKLPPTLIYLKSPKPFTAWQAGQVDNCGLFSSMLNGTRKPDPDSHYWNSLWLLKALRNAAAFLFGSECL